MNPTDRISSPPWAVQIVTACAIELAFLKFKRLTI